MLHLHRLSCGHTESRKRVAPASQIGCTTCGAIATLSPATLTNDEFERISESVIAGTRAELAGALKLDQSAVTIELDSSGRILGARLVLTSDEVARLIGKVRP